MVDPTPLELDAIANNESSLNSLARAIKFSQGQFSLVLACCNYAALQKSMLQKLQEVLGENQYQIQELHLPQTIRTLYRTIQIQLGSLQPSALMVLGLEGVGVLDELLSATNNVRDEFRKRLPFPMVLWVNDEVLQKLLRLAPDFTSWAATPIKFELTANELLKFLTIETNSLFATVLNPGASQELGRSMMHPNSILSKVREESYELHSAISKLLESGVRLPRELEASLEFVFGLDEYISDDIIEALHFFHESLKYWQQSAQNQPEQNNRIKINDLLSSELEILNNDNQALLRQGVLLFYIGLCYSRFADQNQTENSRYWQEAKTYFQQCVNLFEEAKRPDLVAQFIGQLCEVLQHLQEWEELNLVAQKSLELHGKYGTQIQLACNYGFLANIALQESRWERASQYAQTSLLNLADAGEKNDEQQGLFPLLLAQIYQLVLAKAQRNLHQGKIALERLETASRELEKALEHSAHRFDAHRYIRHLQTLELLYFEQGRYPEAFKIKQKRRSVEQQYGFRAFIGAGRLQPQRQATNPAAVRSVAREIDASGRQQDIDRLLGRISRSDQKLTVIHGPSGVGKSSTITAGLVPTLQHRGAIGDQIVVPVVLQDYTEWVRRLGKSLDEGIAQLESAIPREEMGSNGTANSVPGILQKLSENAQKDWITVLIFDQFEEFFFGSPDESQKKEFAQFLRDCLKIPFVKIILSLRDDYLDRLSEFKDLADWEGIDTTIDDKSIQHELKNFSKEDAKKLIEHFIERSQFNLEPDLINALVDDLSAGLGEVRPIELQLVGAQLQDERITKLDQYQRFRTKKVIERYLNQVITDCGSGNRISAQRILCLLVDENKHRPFKTRKELAAVLPELEQKNKLDLVLDILVRSGLVVLFPDVPADRYQLIHDYLIDLIVELKQQQSDLLDDYFLTELQQLSKKHEQNQAQFEQLNSEPRQESSYERQLSQLRSKVIQGQAGIERLKQSDFLENYFLAELQQLIKKQEQNQAEFEQLNSELKQGSGLQRQLSQLRSQVVQGQAEIERLNSELRQKKQPKNGDIQPPQALDLLTELHELRQWEERSRVEIEQLRAELEQQESRKREQLSRIEIDRLYVELEQQKLEAAIAQQEEQRNNQIRRSIFLQRALIGSVTAIIVLTFSIFTAVVQWRQAIISASLADSASSEALFAIDKHIDALKDGLKAGRKLKQAVWVDSQTEEKVRTALYQAVYGVVKERNRLDGHMAEVYSVSFSPTGSLIASASADKTVKLWRPNGKLFKTLSGIHGHTNRVNSVSFSHDGQALASASADNTVKIWSSDGSYQNTLKGHTDVVNSVSFSPDNSLIASASADKTVKIWKRNGTLLRSLSGHDAAVRSVAWSPDGNTLASTSNDKKVILWSRSGKLLTTLLEHKDTVLDVAWAPDSQTLATASLDYTIKLWSRKGGQPLKTFLGHSDGVTSVSFSPDGKTLASASTDKTVKIWSAGGEVLATIKGHSNYVNRVSFSPDGKTLASASKDTTIRLWRSEDLLPLNPDAHTKGVTTVYFSPVRPTSPEGFGKTVASGSLDGTVKLWDLQGKPFKTFPGYTGQVWGVTFSRDGQMLASASKDKTVKLWRRDGTLITTLNGHTDTVFGVSFSKDGKTIASASKDKTVQLWSINGQLLKILSGHTEAVNWVSYSPDGKTIASASDDSTVKLWNKDGKLLQTLSGHQRSVYGVAWSLDGTIIASASIDNTIKLWTPQGKLLNTITGDGDGFTSVSFSPDGQILAAASEEKVKLWSLVDGKLLIALKGYSNGLTSFSFSADGKTLAIGSASGTVIMRSLKDTELNNLLKQGCSWLTDYLNNNSKVTDSDRALCERR